MLNDRLIMTYTKKYKPQVKNTFTITLWYHLLFSKMTKITAVIIYINLIKVK